VAKPSVLVLHNQPLLPEDHPDAESEHTIVGIAGAMANILGKADFRVSQLGLGPDPTALWSELKKRKPDVVFNLFEGSLDNTETESYVAGLLDWAGVPYTGSPAQALDLARAKHTAKYLLKGAGLPTADFLVVNELPTPECDLEYPVIVKPAKQDASIGLAQESVCTNQLQLDQRVQYILGTYGPPVLIEEYVEGREFNVALLELPNLEYLPPSEVIFPAVKPGSWSILTYDGKWKPGSYDYDMTPPMFPADVAPATARKLGRLAMRAYRLIGCRDYARVDFRMTRGGKPYILEVNPNPEISDHAGFTGCLVSAQVQHHELIVRLVRQALSRKNAPKPSFAPVRPQSPMQAINS
jgi:D-alanine-D-alanine ligase